MEEEYEADFESEEEYLNHLNNKEDDEVDGDGEEEEEEVSNGLSIFLQHNCVNILLNTSSSLFRLTLSSQPLTPRL